MCVNVKLDGGAVGNGVVDDGPAIQAAIDMLPAEGGTVDFPTATYKIGTQITVTKNNVHLRGPGGSTVVLAVSSTSLAPIAATGVTNFHISGMHIVGPGATSTAVGLLLTNVNNAAIRDLTITLFDVGLRFAAGGGSCYGCLIDKSQIYSNNEINIDAQADTNNLTLLHTTFGGGPVATGLKFTDSSTLALYGCDCEGASLTCIEIDATSGAAVWSAISISGCHFEGNTSSAGDIRIGETNTINGVHITGCNFAASGSNPYPIRLTRANGVLLAGNSVSSGYFVQSVPSHGTVTNLSDLGNRWVVAQWAGFVGDMKVGGDNTTTPVAPLEVRGATNQFSATGANAQALNVRQATTTLSAMSGATVTATNLIPAGSLVVGVTVRVTTLITGATSFEIGDGTDPDRWGTAIAVTANTTATLANATIATPPIYPAAASVVLTANGSDFTAGAVRVTVHYISLTAPTS